MSCLSTQDPPSLSLPCPRCPVCQETMMPPLEIYQCSKGHFVCQHCHAKIHVTNCRFLSTVKVSPARGVEWVEGSDGVTGGVSASRHSRLGFTAAC